MHDFKACVHSVGGGVWSWLLGLRESQGDDEFSGTVALESGGGGA